ncbi:hypothetical protein HHK36_001091 [Tetracentron sinense]|uniref:B3 domain-containing protein n=1 Tax=Tetracentron sinense TaxID=13715 RepID=A0A834ZWN8_TETSI|nr:hypothetical protein HHK36_001091 [Tetracentron sinense]
MDLMELTVRISQHQGVDLALSSSLLIGASFIVKKKVLKKAGASGTWVVFEKIPQSDKSFMEFDDDGLVGRFNYLEHYDSMIGGYVGSCLMEDARAIFNQMPFELKDLFTFNIMIDGYAREGRYKEVQDVFQELQMVKIEPNRFTMCGKIERAFSLFERMEERDVGAWNSMSSSLAVHGCYVTLSDMYSAVGLYHKSIEVRRRMRNHGMEKVPGCSLIEENGSRVMNKKARTVEPTVPSAAEIINEKWYKEVEERVGISLRLTLHVNDPWKIRKKLTKSDVGQLSRYLLKTELVERHILRFWGNDRIAEAMKLSGTQVKIHDLDTDSRHELTFKRWSSSNSYIINNNWNVEFVTRRVLRKGDEIGLCWNYYSSYFSFSVLRRA